jgi:uncharacterized membrane protein (DUF106 family)
MDQTVTIPYYVIAVVIFVIFPWIIFLHKKYTENSEAIAVMESNLQNIKDDIHELSERMELRIEKLESKIDKIYNLLYEQRGRRNN